MAGVLAGLECLEGTAERRLHAPDGRHQLPQVVGLKGTRVVAALPRLVEREVALHDLKEAEEGAAEI